MASLYSDTTDDNSGGLENATVWGAILNAGAGKATTRTTETGAPTFLIVALAAVALILILE